MINVDLLIDIVSYTRYRIFVELRIRGTRTLLTQRRLATCFEIWPDIHSAFALNGFSETFDNALLYVYSYNSANIVGKSLILVPLERPSNCLSDGTNNSRLYLATHSRLRRSGSHI